MAITQRKRIASARVLETGSRSTGVHEKSSRGQRTSRANVRAAQESETLFLPARIMTNQLWLSSLSLTKTKPEEKPARTKRDLRSVFDSLRLKSKQRRNMREDFMILRLDHKIQKSNLFLIPEFNNLKAQSSRIKQEK